MTSGTQSRPDADKVFAMIKDIRIAMMTTVDTDGSLRSRPMANQAPDSDGNLWFFTRASSHKMTEIGQEHQVNLAYADPSDQNYVSISGFAELVRDRAKIDELWSEPVRAWFPEGKDDPDIALVRVRPAKAEYWDSSSSTLVHLYGYAKAAATGKSPNPGDNAKVDMESAR